MWAPAPGRRRAGASRPKLKKPERQATLRRDAEVVEGLRATGPGLQTRANGALAGWLARVGAKHAGS